MSRTARVAAQAKINLFLRILAREESGYHSLETLFQRIDLADEVQVTVGGRSRTLDCAGPAMPADGLGPVEKNLAYGAALAYTEATGWPVGFEISVEKHIPVGAGLGGGSADAGAVLRALDALAPRPVGEARLLEIATPLGADVPFLTSTSVLSLAWGRGERMLALPPLEPRDVLLAIPAFAVRTADAYAWLAARRGTYAPRACAISSEHLRSWSDVAELAFNDFEDVIAEREPAVSAAAADLRAAGAQIAMLTGSGSAVVGIFERAPNAPTGHAIRSITSRRVSPVRQGS